MFQNISKKVFFFPLPISIALALAQICHKSAVKHYCSTVQAVRPVHECAPASRTNTSTRENLSLEAMKEGREQRSTPDWGEGRWRTFPETGKQEAGPQPTSQVVWIWFCTTIRGSPEPSRPIVVATALLEGGGKFLLLYRNAATAPVLYSTGMLASHFQHKLGLCYQGSKLISVSFQSCTKIWPCCGKACPPLSHMWQTNLALKVWSNE